MLKQLLQIKDGHNILSKYISNHYDEIYSLYNILDKCKVKYKNIKFIKMVDDNNSFSFVCNMSDDDYDKISKYSKDNNRLLRDARKRLPEPMYFIFDVIRDEDDNIHIQFER